jgi:hypothetical protein
LQKRLHSRIPSRLKDDLLIFADIDPDAQGFRYSHTKKGTPRLLLGEYWVPLHDLRGFMAELFGFIEEAYRELSGEIVGENV